jgi:hypothetical protein
MSQIVLQKIDQAMAVLAEARAVLAGAPAPAPNPTPGPGPAPNPPPPPPPPTGGNPSAIHALAWDEVLQEKMQQSGTVFAYPIPAPKQGRASIVFTQGPQPATAAGTVTEYTVSQTPGVIDTGAGKNYAKSGNTANNGITIYTRALPAFGWADATTIPDAFAPAHLGQWYVNVRWTWPVTPPHGYCQFSLQWGEGAW